MTLLICDSAICDLMFGTNGIRGPLNILTPNLAMELGQKIGPRLGKNILVCRDHRLTSPILNSALVSGLRSVGCTVFDGGVLPYPVFEWAVRDYDGGFMITASHNPPEDNGIKVCDSRGIALTKEKANSFLDSEISISSWITVGKYHEVDILSSYLNAIPRIVCDLEVILDYGNGTASIVADHLFSRKQVINSEIDGSFPGRNSEPKEENLDLLKKLCKEEERLGIAWDGDCDRLAFVDEQGNYVRGDYIFALALKLSDIKKTISTVATSKIIEDVVEEVHYVKVGAPYLAEALYGSDYPTAGEEVGGIIWKEFSYSKDSFYTLTKIFNKLNKRLCDVLENFPKYYSVKKLIPVEDKSVAIAKFEEYCCAQGWKLNKVDGVRADFEEGWTICRPSGTEPGVRLFVEHKNELKARRLFEVLEGTIKNH